MGRTGGAARYFSLELLCIFLCCGYPDKVVCYLEECDGKSVVPLALPKPVLDFSFVLHIFVTMLGTPMSWADFFFFSCKLITEL